MIEWRNRKFEELTPQELYAILQLRSEVFVVEQHCIFLDADGKDEGCHHFMGWQGSLLAAYTRLSPPGYMYEEASIGRVVTSPRARGRGIGRQLMEASIAAVNNLFGEQPIKIGAQLYLEKFYGSLGFEQVSEVYLEDGIEHIYMIRHVSS